MAIRTVGRVRYLSPTDVTRWPALKIHFPFDEFGGTAFTDAVSGVVHDVGTAGTVIIGAPAHSVCTKGISGQDAIFGTWPTFPSGKYIYQMMVFRSGDVAGAAGGSNTIGNSGELDDQPQMYSAVANGSHVHITDNAGHQVSSDVDPSKVAVIGNDYLMMLIVRPAGQNIEGRLYSDVGVLLWSHTILNPAVNGIGEITPGGGGGSAGLPGSPCWGQGPTYLRATYQFDAEPANLAEAVQWHVKHAICGDKRPFIGWKMKT